MELWKNIKPFPKQIKGCRGYNIGYGYCTTRNKYGKSTKRKLGRYIRKYGFDITETWNLDNTIMMWLADNIGGFFRECGDYESWNTDYEGNEWDFGQDIRIFAKAENERRDFFQKGLESWLGNTKDYTKFIDFVIPRLIYLRQNTHGYPADFKSLADWQQTLENIIVDFQHRQYFIFTRYFFNLWD